MTREYSEAAVEVLNILDHTSNEKVKLIPESFIKYLKENAAKDYDVELDYSKPIGEMNVKTETMGILGTICRNWWWSEEENQEYTRIVREKEYKRQEELKEKYNPDDVFKNKKQSIKQNESVDDTQKSSYQMIEHKENIFSKIMSFIKNLFRKK